MIAFVCPKCGQKLRVKDEVAGKRAKRPHCAAVLTIPAAPAPVPTMATGSRLRPAARRTRDRRCRREPPSVAANPCLV